MFRRISSQIWIFVLIFYTLFLEAHCVPEACAVCFCQLNGNINCVRSNLTAIPKNAPSHSTRMLLSHNSIKNISEGAFGNLQSLQEIDLCDNSITNISKGAFENLQSLQRLELAHNSITHITNDTFEHLESLDILILSGNSIKNITRGVFENKKSLRILDLSQNSITTIAKGAFENLRSLQSLTLSGNSINNITKGVFEGLRSLHKLDLSHNSITTIEKGAFENLQSLQILDLSRNSIPNITEGVFQNLQSLRELYLTGNPIVNIAEGSFVNLQSLQELVLIASSITTIEKGAFGNLQSIEKIDLSGNSITTITKGAFGNLHRLPYLYLSLNSITDIAKGAFEDLQSLKKLHLAHNSITKITKGVFENLPSLIYLELCDNSITNIAKGAFENLQSLRSLCLSNNAITNVTAGAFGNIPSLQSLTLSDNSVTNIPKGAFVDLPRLRFLDLRNNSITNIRKGAFENLRSLKILDLSNNRIKSYEDGAFLFLPSLKEIDLRGNKDMMCGCHLPALVKYMKNNYRRLIYIKGECQTDLGTKVNIRSYSQCTNYSLFQRNLQCQTCLGMSCNDSEVTTCPGAEPVCRLNLSMKGVNLKLERSCSTYKECVEAMRNNARTCNKTTDGISCTGCCVGNSCNKNDFIGWTNFFQFHLTIKKLNEHNVSNENISRDMEQELKNLTGTFKVEYCGLERSRSIFTIYSWILKETTKDDLWLSINQVFKTSQTLHDLGVQQHNVELIDGMVCYESTTSNNGTFHWPVTKTGTNATIPYHANVVTRYCSSRTVNHLEMASSQFMSSLKCSPFTGIWQEPDMSKCNDTKWITQRLKDITKQDIDQGNIDNISKEVLNVSQKSVYFKKEDIDLAVDILERMVPFMSNVSVNTTISNTLLSINNMINTSEEVLVESEQDNTSVSRMLDIIETIPERIPLEEQQVKLSYSNLGVGVAKVNKDTFNGLFYGVSYGTDGIETKSVLYNRSYPDPQQGDIQTTAFISIPKSLPKRMTDEESSALSRISFFSMRDDKLYRITQNSSTDVNTTISSYVLAASIPNNSISNLDEPVNISFSLINQNVTNPRCVYWDETPGENSHWSTKGCKVSKNVPGKEIVCSCDKLSSFALLKDVHQNEDVSLYDVH